MFQRIVLAVLLCLFLVGPASAADQWEVCAEYAEYGLPSTDGTLLCRMGYLLAHDDYFFTPIWVAERLTKERALAKSARKGTFRSDPDLLVGRRAELDDYKGSGYDRGHMAPSADFGWSSKAMGESYLLSNMIPQNGLNNQQIWANLEAHVRDWAILRGEIFIYTGPVYTDDKAEKTIGANKIGVPDRLYKIVYDPHRKEAIAFLMPNAPLNTKDLPKYIVSVREIECLTGLNFLSTLPRKEQNQIEKAKAEMWARK